MQNQKLQEIIQSIKHTNPQKPSQTLKKLRVVLKAFNAYSTTADHLPPPTLIPVCLFLLPNLFKELVGLEEGESLESEPEQRGVRLSLQLYLRGLLRLLGECEGEIQHVVVQSMVQSMPLVAGFTALRRKWGRALVGLWAGCGDNLNLGLRCFVALDKALKNCDDDFYVWALRRLYVAYFQQSAQLAWRTLQHINFMANCFCELARLRPQKAYYVLFGYVRSLAMQLQSLNNSKGKEKRELIAKLYSQQTLQALKLLVQVVGKGGEEELAALAFPLAQLISAYEHISQAPQYITLKLHLLQIQLQLMENTGLYLPQVLQSLIKILKSSPLQRKRSRKAGVEGSIQLGYKLSLEELKNTNILNDIFNKAVFYLHWLATCAQKTLAAPELTLHISKLVQPIKFGFSGHRKAIKAVLKIIIQDAQKIELVRAKRKLALGSKASQKFENSLVQGKISLETTTKYQDLLVERESLFKARVQAEHEEEAEDSQINPDEAQDQEELESGWQQASEGASEFEQQPQAVDSSNEQSDQQGEQVSYQGDPSDASEAIKQWSEHEWSSQQQLQA